MARPTSRQRRIEPDPEVVARLATTALKLPEAYEEDAQPGYESSHRDITGIVDPTTVLTFRATGEELLALAHAGPPFYKPPWSPTIVGMALDDETDWAEVADLVIESYRICAPQKLVRLLED